MWNRAGRVSSTTAAADSDPAAADSGKVVIYESEARRIAEYTQQYPDIETGGDLFGYWTHSGAPVVMFVIGPGQRCRRSPTSFYQDEHYLHERGIELYDQHGLQHIGEWHSHHRLGLNEPSGGDLRTVQNGMRRQGWNRFLLVIAALNDREVTQVTENHYLVNLGANGVQPLRIKVLPGVSPFHASDIDAREERLVRPASHVVWRPGPNTPSIETRRAVGQAFPDAWFSRPENKDRLRRIVQDFGKLGTAVRMLPEAGGAALRLLVFDEQILLGPGFPDEAPVRLTADGKRDSGVPWSSGMHLLDWYEATRRAERARHGTDFKAPEGT